MESTASHITQQVAAARSQVVVVALSEDPALLDATIGAVGEQTQVIASPSIDRFVDQMVANPADIVLLDAALLQAPIAGFLESLRRQFPSLLLVLAGPPQLQKQIAPQLADGTIFRFAHKPVSAQRLKFFIDAALAHRESDVQHELASVPSAAAASDDVVPVETAAVRPQRTYRSALIAGVLLLTIAGAGYWVSHRPTDAADRPLASAVSPASAATPSAVSTKPTAAPETPAVLAPAATAVHRPHGARAERHAAHQKP